MVSQSLPCASPSCGLTPTPSSDEPECPFCGDPFSVTVRDSGMAWGVCYLCAEPVAVDL